MADFSNIPTGLKITSQIPLDVKKYVKDESTLAYLGANDNLAFTYHDQLEVLCLEEKSKYIWREVQPGEENTGLVPLDFTYPLNLPETYGINYSGKKYNFFLKKVLTVEELNNLVIIRNVGNEIGIYKDSTINNNQIEFNFKTLTSNDNSVLLTELPNTINLQSKIYIEQGSNITITGDGTELNPFIINSTGSSNVSIEDGTTTIVNGDGVTTPYSVEVVNLQKTIDTFPYTLTNSDDKHTIFIENGLSFVTINVPDGLVDNFSCVFIQEGSGRVTIQQSGTATLLYPSISLQNIIKDQYYWAMVEKKTNTNTYYLLGSLLPV